MPKPTFYALTRLPALSIPWGLCWVTANCVRQRRGLPGHTHQTHPCQWQTDRQTPQLGPKSPAPDRQTDRQTPQPGPKSPTSDRQTDTAACGPKSPAPDRQTDRHRSLTLRAPPRLHVSLGIDSLSCHHLIFVIQLRSPEGPWRKKVRHALP